MIIFPAIDLYEKKAVRLFKGDYNQMTVYDNDPVNRALMFKEAGATHMHMVDLEGAKLGTTPNIDVVEKCVKETGLFVEIGGGIREMDTVDRYISSGASRVILGTAAVTNPDFAEAAVKKYGDKIAVGIDIKDGKVAIKGWLEKSDYTPDDFCLMMQNMGISTMICTDISRDGAMKGANLSMYAEMSKKYSMDIIASGGVSTMEDIKELSRMRLYGAIVGKAYYIGAIDLKEAILTAKGGV